jgi:hypothetical protein
VCNFWDVVPTVCDESRSGFNSCSEAIHSARGSPEDNPAQPALAGLVADSDRGGKAPIFACAWLGIQKSAILSIKQR